VQDLPVGSFDGHPDGVIVPPSVHVMNSNWTENILLLSPDNLNTQHSHQEIHISLADSGQKSVDMSTFCHESLM